MPGCLLLRRNKGAVQSCVALIAVNRTGKATFALDSGKQRMRLVIDLTQNRLKHRIDEIDNISSVIDSYHPNNILSKGYAIPHFDKRLLENQKLRLGDKLEIEL